MATRLVRTIPVRHWRRYHWTPRHLLNGASITWNLMGVMWPLLCWTLAILLSFTCRQTANHIHRNMK